MATRMAMAVQDDRGTYSIPPGARRRPYNVVLAEERDEWLGYGEDPAKWAPTVAALTGWAPWTYAVDFHRHCYFVDGDSQPNTALYATEMAEQQRVTAEDVKELLTSGSMEPTLVRWLDTGEVEVVAGVLFSDISYSNREREYDVIATANDLRQQGDWDIEHPTQDDYEAFAEQLNDPA